MSVEAILAPVFVQVALMFFLMFYMAGVRTGALRRREVQLGDVALGQQNWPPHVTQVANCYNSQFQVPVLFYVLTILVIITHHADFLFVVMAWLFVLTRLLHTYIHTGSNYVRHRFNAFALGAFILLAMWIIYAVRILLGLP